MNDTRLDFRKKFYFEVILIILFVITLILYVGKFIPAPFELVTLYAVAILGFIPVGLSTFQSLMEKKVNVDLLASIALILSFVSGEWGSLLFINMMLGSARVLDLYTKRRVRTSLESLIKLKPSRAHVLRNGESNQAIEIPLNDVVIGDLVVVNLGEQIPVDGRIYRGSATINQASLTGESLPVLRNIDESVLSATFIVSGNIIVRAERIGAETTFERMIKLVEKSQSEKTRMKTLAERFASWYIGIMLIVSILLYMLTKDILLVLSVVLVVCADDIAIAIPLAYIAGIGTAAKQGIIIKGADFLERAAKITTLIVDKTGTLTMGNLAVKKVHAFGDVPLQRALELSGIICHGSTHPVAKAIVKYTEQHSIICNEPDSFEETEGRGMKGTKGNDQIVIGRIEFLNENKVWLGEENYSVIKKEEAYGNNVTLVALNGRVVGMFALADEIRPGVAKTIAALKREGIEETVMLTGDNEAVAQIIAKETGIDEYYSGLLPEKKVALLGQYLGKTKVVAMVGDGVNDAAVLTRADIGIAMGGIGSDAAIESANIVLMKDDFEKLIELRTIAKNVLAVARENFVIWGIVNVVGLYLVFRGVLHPSGAAAYNFLTDFIPIGNSLRLFNYQRKNIY